MSEFKPYLHSALIEGYYKSIVKCDVWFKPGLNIIIGKNGTGKTNLLEGIRNALSNDFDFLDNEPAFSTKLTFANDESVQNRLTVSIEAAPVQEMDSNLGSTKPRMDLENRIRVTKFYNGELFPLDFRTLENLVSCLLFAHGTPSKVPFLSDGEAGWKVSERTQVLNKYSLENSVFTKLQVQIANSIYRLQFTERSNSSTISEVVHHALREFADRVLPWLKICTPITGLEVLNGRTTNGILKGQLEVKGYFLEFEVNGNHLAFENLSDGTRRIFLIVAELCELENSFQISADYNASLFLLEEPELGIHPHQLHLLMNFIKEQSKEKQIILTTHSPQVLDILNEDELDRIIIAEFDPQNGSTFRHLDPKEEKKARFIMKEEPLSSYWRYSDLERSLSVK